MRPLLAAVLVLAAGAQGARAQIAPDDDDFGVPGPLLSAEISQSFTVDTNFDLDDPNPGTSYYADTRLILGLVNATPIQTFELGLDTGLRALWEAEEDFEFTFASPTTANVGYDREWASGALDSFLRYRQRDVDSTALVDLDPVNENPDDLREIRTDATERRYDGGLDLEFATDSPSSYQIGLAATRIDYSGDTGGNRTPRATIDTDARWLLQLNPTLAGGLAVRYYTYDADNPQQTEIRQSEIDAGVIYDPSNVLQLTLGVGYGTYRREQIVGGERTTLDDNQGYVLRGAVRYQFEDVTLDAAARLTNAAPETRLSGDVRARYPLARGALTGRLYQNYGGGDTGEEIRVTGATIGLAREINTVSDLTFAVSAALQENLDTDEPDTNRLNFTATYSRDITAVVSANLGYRFRALDEDPDQATSNAVFFEIGRTFETRP